MAHNARVGALLALSVLAILSGVCQAGFYDIFNATWGGVNVHANDTDKSVLIDLTADGMGSTFTSSDTYLFGSYKTRLRLVRGNSAGTVSAFFLISKTDDHDEIDFEFLGNATGEPYLIHTNLFANGVGDREQEIYAWFDPTEDFHTYQVIWNPRQVLWLIDDIPIRVHKNLGNVAPGTFPISRPMVVSGCIFQGSEWATQGGRIPIDYDYAPFNVTFQDYEFDACMADGNSTGTCANPSNATANWWNADLYHNFNVNWADQMAWVRKHYLVYDYCYDTSRNPSPPEECSYNYASSSTGN